jgi:Type III restriction enzyme, res subunit
MVDAACGAGKSFALHRAINNLALKNTDIIVVVPSIKLIKQYEIDLGALSPALKVNTIHSENVDDDQKPVILIMNYLRNEHPGEVLLITQQSFNIICGMLSHQKSRHLIIDEIPVPFSLLRYGDKDEHKNGLKRILECIDVQLTDTDPSFYAVACKDEPRLQKIARERDEDGNYTELQVLAYQLLSKNHVNVVNRKLWDSHRIECIDLYSCIHFNIYHGYQSVTIAGACFTDSALYKLWSRNGVTFQSDENLMKTLRYIKHQNGSEVQIYYSLEGHTWSQNLMKGEKDCNGNATIFGPNLKLIEEAVLKLFDGEEFIYTCNFKYEGLVFERIDTAHILPQTIHGMNCWMEYNNVACIAARNIDINYQRFLETYVDLDIEEIHNIIGREFTYQSVLRSAIRDIKNHDIKRVYVVDKGSALFLADQLEGAELIHLPIEGLKLPKRAGRPRMHKSEAARKAKKRSQQTVDDVLIEKARDERDTYRGWLFKTKYDNLGFDPVFSEEYRDMEDQMNILSNKTHGKKTDNHLICPSFFDGKPRSRENVVFANGIFLDIDGKDKPPIHPEEFAKLFPHVRMTAFNTYSSTLEWIRYRVWIPTDRVMTADEYISVTTSMVDLIPKDAGIDKTKLYPENIFYPPCQAEDVFGNYFGTFEESRRVLYVDDWVLPDHESNDAAEAEVIGDKISKTRNDDKMRKAIENWSPATAPKGYGNQHTFILACQLKKAGLDKWQAQKIMLDEASKCSSTQSRADRRKQVEDIMNKWRLLR